MRRRRSIFDIIDEYIEEIEEAAEDIIGGMFERPSWDVESSSLCPLFNISVTPDNVIVTVDLPYAKPDSIRVEAVDDKRIEVLAKMRRKVRFEDLGVSHMEGEFSCLRCQIPLPVPVDLSRAKAKFRRGILELTIPKRKGYRIKVE